MDDPRQLTSPAFARNVAPILSALGPHLRGLSGPALEIGCGPGQHAVAFARAHPALDWTPSDPDPAAVASAAAWRAAHPLPNLRPPVRLDAAADWAPGVGAQRVVCAVNVLHIAPLSVTRGLVAGAGRALAAGGVLAVYGPFVEDGVATAPSNLAFDASLRARDPAWGLRRLSDVAALARAAGLGEPAVARLPANNLLVVWRRG